MQTHVKVLAVLFIVSSALGVLVALGVMAMFAGAAGIVGATAEGEDAVIAMPIIGLTGSFLTIFLLVVSLPGLITGFGLLSLRPWARILGIVLSAINLINFFFFPIGIVMGAYGLWVLLSKDTEHLFENQLASP